MEWRQLVPREHGAWFMWVLPLALGAALSRITSAHGLLVGAALAFHLAGSAMTEAVRQGFHRSRPLQRWSVGLTLAGILLVGYPVWRWPVIAGIGAGAAGLIGLHLWLVRLRRERTLTGDALAIAGVTLWAPVSYLAGAGSLDRTAWVLWALCFLFFMGTAFHVKSVFRERDNPRFKWVSNGVHMGLLAVPAMLGVPQAAAAFLPSAVRAWATPQGRRIRPLTAGLIEMTNALLFAVLLLWLW